MSLMRRRMMMQTNSQSVRSWMEIPFDHEFDVAMLTASDNSFFAWYDWSNIPPEPEDVRIYGARQIAEAPAYYTVFCVTTYYPSAAHGRNCAGVKYGLSGTTSVNANIPFLYREQIWYYSAYGGYSYHKSRIELNPSCIDLTEVTGHAHSNNNLEQAARDLLDYYYGVI